MLLLVNKNPEERPSACDVLKHPLMEMWAQAVTISPRDY